MNEEMFNTKRKKLKKAENLQTDQFKWDVTVLAMAADRIFHADSAITNSNGRTMFPAQAVYYSLFVTHSNSNSANFGPNERTVEWATYSVLCLCTLCLVCIATIFWLPLVRWILEQLWPLPFAYFHHLIMSWLFHNPSKYYANRLTPQIHCTRPNQINYVIKTQNVMMYFVPWMKNFRFKWCGWWFMCARAPELLF